MIYDTIYVIEKIIAKLGYREDTGWVPAAAFSDLEAHRFALQQAHKEMGVYGAFCLKQPISVNENTLTPIVYVANAETLAMAQEIHRKVWSQGLVPFLIVVIPGEFLICPGFSYTTQGWEQLIHKFPWELIDSLPESPLYTGNLTGSAQEIWDLRALRLRTSLFWHDHAIDVEGRVDRRLLDSLGGLSDALIAGTKEIRGLSPTAANRLIGRFLYIYFLFDRNIIDQNWVHARGHDIALDNKAAEWSEAATWSLFDDLDAIFNGSIFPLGKNERQEIEASHINLVRRVMKHGSEPFASGAEQLSFLDFYLGAIRTETLSAVYEQFLKNLKSGEQRRSGAFYTPPFLVDFVLDRLEEEKVLKHGVRVLDPAAGSGVFLVGAYRRMIERALWSEPSNSLNLDELRGILTQNIFGIERNRDACHVAAFSLYLTLLDYVNPRDLTRVAAGEEPESLFPQLINRNIHVQDFFDDGKSCQNIQKMDCVIGNPPWQALRELESAFAKKWRDEHKKCSPIGNDQAAELFVWKAMRNHLQSDGILAFLMPTKSFINPTSEAFRSALGREFTIIGAANFSHFRHRLFANAKQATAAVFLRPRRAVTRDTVWIYSPWSVGQPVAKNAWPWTLILDRAEVQKIRHSELVRGARGWFDAFLLRPIDRHIRHLLDDKTMTEQAASLEILCARVGARISRGGNSDETGVDAKFLLSAPTDAEHSIGEFTTLLDDHYVEVNSLPAVQFKHVRPSYRNRFGGNVLFIPRNMKSIGVVRYPVAYTSSITAMFFDKPAEQVSGKELKLLEAVGRYLTSDVGRYLVATTGRRWLIDRRNIEPKDLRALVIPIRDLEDTRIDSILQTEDRLLTDHLIKLLGLDSDLRLAIDEFLDFRINFRDGAVPSNALSLPEPESFSSYEDVVNRTLDGLIGRKNAFLVETLVNDSLGIGAVATCFRSGQNDFLNQQPLTSLCENAIERYCSSAANSFEDSLALSLSDETTAVTMVKPLERFRWTTDSAFSDSQKIIQAFMADNT